VLAGDLGIPCENTAKWLHDHDHGCPTFTAGQLVIIDEATLAGTMALDRLTALAAEAGAKVLLVGDWAQIQSVDAGGAFALLADARDDTPELVEVHRFTHEWEKQASLDLRHARTEVIATYLLHERVKEGTTEDMLHEAYAAWRSDVHAGLSSVLVTESAQAVSALNQRARAERITTGETEASREVELADGNCASAGDLIITRRNDRRLRTLPGGFVRNGDCWIVADIRKDGSIVARRQGHRIGTSVALPATYVAEHVDLGTPSPRTEPRASPSTPPTSWSPAPRPGRISTSP
jgi:ATP-dependent exoDNAse (exonuclease V) alpha subunit